MESTVLERMSERGRTMMGKGTTMTASTWQIEADELRGLLDRHATVTVLDVRTNEDHAEWAIPGSLHVDAYDRAQGGRPSGPGRSGPAGRCPGRDRLRRRQGQPGRGRAVARPRVRRALARRWHEGLEPGLEQRRSARPGQRGARRPGAPHRQRLPVLPGRRAATRRSSSTPRCRPEVYQDLAAERGWPITHVLDTHVHADHLSRARRLPTRPAPPAPARRRIASPTRSTRCTTATRPRSATRA